MLCPIILCAQHKAPWIEGITVKTQKLIFNAVFLLVLALNSNKCALSDVASYIQYSMCENLALNYYYLTVISQIHR